jgi:hypothetical protein
MTHKLVKPGDGPLAQERHRIERSVGDAIMSLIVERIQRPLPRDGRTRGSLKTLVFYVTAVGREWRARLYGAVTIEPFEVSLWRGGCGGLLWDFNQAGSVVGLRCGRFVAGA